jgi:hypothetical protein
MIALTSVSLHRVSTTRVVTPKRGLAPKRFVGMSTQRFVGVSQADRNALTQRNAGRARLAKHQVTATFEARRSRDQTK